MDTYDLRSELIVPAETAARRLLGGLFIRHINGQKLVGKIVETEAYDQTDAASHSYRGRTPRTDIMFGPAGHLYVYFTYGMHYCCNVVTGEEGHGSAVLIRALEPTEGSDIMSENRGGRSGVDMTNGPAKVCQALGIDKSLNGFDLTKGPLTNSLLTKGPGGDGVSIELQAPIRDELIVQTTRIGISQAKDVPWRFYLKDNPYVSRR